MISRKPEVIRVSMVHGGSWHDTIVGMNIHGQRVEMFDVMAKRSVLVPKRKFV